MSEIALYRKYRPQKFSEVVGQDHVVKVLENAIKDNNISHAYLFAGSRGTGKTSIARILAREIGTSPNDLYEIDAASNRGIDEIRELREAVRTLPFDSQYKVYIIDEVHMLTKEAFNALLKTLEEPPSHVIFILATTETHKLPETIVSRCQTFNFKSPTLEELKGAVGMVAKKEGYSIDSESAELIALMGDGSFRDTYGVLQKVITASGDKKLEVEEVEKITGSPSSNLINSFILALVEKKAESGLRALHAAALANHDMSTFLKRVMRKLRLAMLYKWAPEMHNALVNEMSKDELESVRSLASHPSAGFLPQILRECLTTYDQLGKSYLPELPLELLLIRWSGSN